MSMVGIKLNGESMTKSSTQIDVNPNLIADAIKNGDNIVSIPNFICGYDLEAIQEDFENVMSKVPLTDEYKFGKATRTGCIEDNKKYLFAHRIFSAPWINEVSKAYFGKYSFTELFWTHEFRTDLGTETNGFLHFDKIGPTLKFLLYLTDATRETGALRCCRGTRTLGKKLREQAWKETTDYNILKNKPEIDYPELGYTSESAEDMIGLAGTLLVFDSDIFHMGGITEPGKERKLIRLHVRP